MPNVVAWPDKYVAGWDGQIPPVNPITFFERIDLREALLREWQTDAHAVGYLVGDEPSQPRLKIGSLRELAARGAPPFMQVIFIDIDREPHEPWPDDTDLAEAVDDVAAQLRHFTEADPIVFTTRAGMRAVFVLDDPLPCNVANAWLRGFIKRCAAVVDTDELQVDATSAQWSRCFRMPSVMRDGHDTSPTFNAGASAWLGGSAELRPLTVGDLSNYAIDERPAAGVHEADRPDRPDAVPPHHWQMLMRSAMGKALAKGARAGERLAEPGKRDTDLLRAVGCAARLLGHEGTPEAVYALLHDSVFAMSAAGAPSPQDAPDVSKLWRVCCEVCAREQAQLAERIADTLAAREANAEHDARDALRTPAPTLGEQPTIIVSGSRFHVFTDPGVAGAAGIAGGYGPSVPSVALTSELRVRQPGVARRTDKGALLDVRELIDRHGTIAEHIVAVMGTDRTTFDPMTRTLRLKACTMRAVTPRRSQAIEQWLRKLVPDAQQHARLLDWLACLLDLTRPIAALYLQGPRGGGKTLLVKGIASLWSDAPVPFETAIGRFNRTAMCANPIVHLSEGLDYLADGRRSSVSASFRALIADGTHRVEEKHEVGGDLIGHPRCIIAANRDDALPLGGHHTRDDIAAIAQRVLHIMSGDARVSWDEAEGWLNDGNGGPGLIGAHIAWLAANRNVERGRRFLVEGVETEWHRGLVLRSGHNAQVLAAIASAALQATKRKGRGDGAVMVDATQGEHGIALVNAARLHGQWRTFVDEDQHRPTRSAVARTLRELSTSGRSCSKRDGSGIMLRWWQVPAELVLRVADWHGISGLDALAEAFAGKPPAEVPVTVQGAQ